MARRPYSTKPKPEDVIDAVRGLFIRCPDLNRSEFLLELAREASPRDCPSEEISIPLFDAAWASLTRMDSRDANREKLIQVNHELAYSYLAPQHHYPVPVRNPSFEALMKERGVSYRQESFMVAAARIRNTQPKLKP